MANRLLRAAVLVGVVLVSPVQAADDEPAWDGLVKVKSSRVDDMYLLPGADFRGYTRVILDPIQVSFRKDWQEEMNRGVRSARPRVTAEDAERIRRQMGDAFAGILADEFARVGFEIVDAPGPDVLRLTPLLMDVFVAAPDTERAVRMETYTLEAGEATMALEVRDAETNQLLGRSVDERGTGRSTTMTWTTSVTNRSEFDRLFRRWASILAGGMSSLKAASPIKAPEER